MLRTTLRSLWSHKRRLISTCVAIVLGVAFISGTLVLNGTVGKVFDDLFADLGEGIDAQVRGDVVFESEMVGTIREFLPESTVEAVAAVDGVAAAEGSIVSMTSTVVDSDGEAMGGAGPPVIVGSWDTDPGIASYQIDSGRAPEALGEAIIDRSGAASGKLEIGDDLLVITGTDRFELTLVGISRFGDADSAGGSVFVGTNLAQAQEIAGEPGMVNTVNARAEDGVTPEELVHRIAEADVAEGADVVTGKQASDEAADSLKELFGFFTWMLTIFALIALFVGWFIISNTFSILVAQRTRELALLRAIGATRRQVMGSVLAEAVIIGGISAVLGLIAGILLAFGGFTVLKSAGLDLPSASLVIPTSAIFWSITAGLVVTIIAAIMPAVRATRVPPIAALRDVAIDVSDRSRIRAAIGVFLLVGGAFFASTAFVEEPTTSDAATVGFGIVLILVAVLTLGPVLATPLARVVGSWIPLVKGITGKLARQNAMRSPRRTASTAAALIIGVALIVFITVFAQSTTKSIDKAIGAGFAGDYIVMPANQLAFTGAPPQLGDELAEVDGVGKLASLRTSIGQVRPDGEEDGFEGFFSGIDPATTSGIFDFKMYEGTVDALEPGKMIVDRQQSREREIEIGDTATIVSMSGREVEVEVAAIGNDSVMLGEWVLHIDDLAEIDPQAGVAMLAFDLEPGFDVEEMRPALREVTDEYPQMKLQDREQFKSGIISQINQLLLVIYVLLLVSVVISMIGISNTLSLSIHERTRELGLLRAMGMTRRQLRSSVRWEAVIVALIGTAIGIILGIGLSYLMVKVLSSQGITDFSAPPQWMIPIALIAAGLAVVASLRPAWKASKLNVLEAIAQD